MAKKTLFFMIASIFVLALSACSGGEAYSLAYTARGEGANSLGLTKTDFFRDTEDINVVVKLNDHDGVTVSARFLDPSGEQVGDVLETEVDSDVGSVVLGLDYEQRNALSEGEEQYLWAKGTWKVEIRVDGENVDTINFDID